ncbi:MAG: SulP family inorganic anion transporter [Flavicella sp.]
MIKKQSAYKTFINDLPKNMFAGFVVSLIALPLGIGLALGSDAPPIAGIISCIVGGITVAILGGSHVTITGPGYGLVVVLLNAITTLGAGDLHQGYLYTLAAIVFSGIILTLLGFLRLGVLGDFFPSSAIQGMLAAIGVGIIAKQFHIMFGNTDLKGSTVDMLLDFPNTIIPFFANETDNTTAGIIGLGSLFIMFFYSKVRNKFLQLVPAPMWIVVITVGLGYYFEFFSTKSLPIAKNLIISFPADLINTLAFPDFSKIGSFEFLNAVIAITLISSIESLLSIKASDKIDAKKRRSNVNKDLKALGIASTLSAFLGGLNVVTVIARSSVNANNGATNRSANFFHGLFILLFIVLFQNQIRMIPLTALSAILVYTGYKLANPTNAMKIFKIGNEQFIIFLTTLLVTIFTNLIVGIACGIFATFAIHVILNKSINIFVRNIFKPNVLMYKENDEKGTFYVSIVNFCSFLNFSKLKSKLDQIPEHSDVIVDFSRCSFVDHTVMENVSNYIVSFTAKGGHFEVIGLDLHGAHTSHPFALRRISQTKRLASGKLTKRQKSLKNIAKDFHWTYKARPENIFSFLKDFEYFKTKEIKRVKNVLTDEKCTIFDVLYTEGAFIAKQVIRSTMMHIKTEKNIPSFTLDRDGIFEYLSHLIVHDDIHIKNHPDFTNRFSLSGKDKARIEEFFTDELVLFFESNSYYHIEATPNGLLIVNKERLGSVKEIKAMASFGKRLKKVINNNNSLSL